MQSFSIPDKLFLLSCAQELGGKQRHLLLSLEALAPNQKLLLPGGTSAICITVCPA